MTSRIDINLPWWQLPIIVLDLEGTGAQHKEKEGIVEIAAIEIMNGQISSNSFYSLVNPEIAIPAKISQIHGLQNGDLIAEPIFELIKKPLLNFIDHKILLGHYISVDYRVLRLKMNDYEPALILDTWKLAKFLFKDIKVSLDNLITHFDIASNIKTSDNFRGRHSAFYDASATALIFLEMMKHFDRNTTLKTIIEICSIEKEDSSKQGKLF